MSLWWGLAFSVGGVLVGLFAAIVILEFANRHLRAERDDG